MSLAPSSSLLPREPRHHLLIAATVAPQPAARAAYVRWREGVDLNTLDGPSVRMLPLLERRLDAADGDELAREIGRVARFMWVRSHSMIHGVLPALQRLADEGIPALMVKGIAVALHSGLDLGTRYMNDLDVCVPLDRVPAAAHALLAAGFRCDLAPLLAGHPQAIVRTVTGVPFADERGRMLDLHWHLLHERRHPRADEDFWAAARPAELRGVPCLITAPEDTLVHVMEHGGVWHGEPVLQWTTDAALLVRESRLDWDRVVWVAGRQRLSPVIADGLEYLRRVAQVDVPDSVIARLAAGPAPRVERALARAATLGPARARALARETARDLDETLPPGACARTAAAAAARAATRRWYTGRRRHPRDLPPVRLDEPLRTDLRPDGTGTPHLVAGWHYPEPHGTWSRDRVARIVLPLAEAGADRLLLTADVVAFVTYEMPRLEVDVALGHRRLVTWSFHGTEPAGERRAAWIPARRGRRILDLRLTVREPRDGVEADFNGDPRPLGIAISTLTLTSAEPPAPPWLSAAASA